jgi:putative oxidoreductase
MYEKNHAAYAALLLRVSLGTMLIAHGLLKVMVYTLPGSAQYFASVGFPGWLAYPVVAMELLGGALMLGGVATRAVAVALVPVMLGALSVHWGNGWVFSNAKGGWEYPALLTLLLLVQVLLGAGAYAIGGKKPEAARV